jgi:hypothetical protein
MPPVADISDAKTARVVASPSWEKTYENMEGQFQRDITQMSADVASTPGSLAETRVEQQIEPALPAKGSEAVVIGTVLSGQSHLAANNHVVYSSYQITLDQVLKPSGKRFQRDHQTADVIVFGGGLRFPTGHVEYFVIHGTGFLGVGKRYLFFLWRSDRKMKAYDVAGAYLLEDQLVYPIVTGGVSPFSGSSVTVFEQAVRSAIRDNADR